MNEIGGGDGVPLSLTSRWAAPPPAWAVLAGLTGALSWSPARQILHFLVWRFAPQRGRRGRCLSRCCHLVAARGAALRPRRRARRTHVGPVLPDARRLWPLKSPGVTGLSLILPYKIGAGEPCRGILLSWAHDSDSWAVLACSQRLLKVTLGTSETTFSDL